MLLVVPDEDDAPELDDEPLELLDDELLDEELLDELDTSDPDDPESPPPPHAD